MSETEQEATDLETAIAAEMTPDETGPPEDAPAEVEEESDALAEPETEPDSQAEMEAIGKKLDALQKYVARKMGDILGEQAQSFEECEVCSYYNTPGWRLSGPYPTEVDTAVRTVLGMRSPAELAKDNYAHVCDACNGFGETLSGSKVPGRETLPCYVCKANGWVPVGDERANTGLFVANGPAAAFTPPADSIAPQFTQDPADEPEVAALKAKGYMVVPPFVGTP